MADAGASWSRRGALLWLGLLAVLALAAPWLPVQDPAHVELAARSAAPSLRHWLGTDALGRDLLARVLYGARPSLVIAAAAPLLGLLLGGGVGLLAGYRRGWADVVVRVLIDTALAFPALILALVVCCYAGRSLPALVATLTAMCVPACARVARSAALSVSRRDYVLAASAGGASALRILWRHVLPNVWPRLANFGLLLAALVMVVEGALGFLGLSVPPPRPSWGSMIAEGRARLEEAPFASLAPAAALFSSVLALNVLGDRGPGQARSTRDAQMRVAVTSSQ